MKGAEKKKAEKLSRLRKRYEVEMMGVREEALLVKTKTIELVYTAVSLCVCFLAFASETDCQN